MLEAHTNKPPRGRAIKRCSESGSKPKASAESIKATENVFSIASNTAKRLRAGARRFLLTSVCSSIIPAPSGATGRSRRLPPKQQSLHGLHLSPNTKEQIARLEDDNHRLRHAADDLFVPQDTAADIARLLADRLARLTPTKAKEVIGLLPELYAEGSTETPHEKARLRSRKKRRTIEGFQRDLAAK